MHTGLTHADHWRRSDAVTGFGCEVAQAAVTVADVQVTAARRAVGDALLISECRVDRAEVIPVRGLGHEQKSRRREGGRGHHDGYRHKPQNTRRESCGAT